MFCGNWSLDRVGHYWAVDASLDVHRSNHHGGLVDFLEDSVDFDQVRLQSQQESFRLSVLGRGTDGDGVVLDNVADTESVGADWTETEKSKRGVAAVGGRDDSVVQLVPSGISKDLGQGTQLQVRGVLVVAADGFVGNRAAHLGGG